MKLKECEWLRSIRLAFVLGGGVVVAAACSEGDTVLGAATGGRGVTNSGGTGDDGGASGEEGGSTSNPETGGAAGSDTGGGPNQGGASSGGEANGGDVSTGGDSNGGEVTTGGEVGTGGEANGGEIATGGEAAGGEGVTGGRATGGEGATGGTTGGTGGEVATGGEATGGDTPTGGTGGTTGGTGGATGGTGGTTGGTGGATGCIALDDGYVDLFDDGGIRGHAWGYHWREGLSAELELTSGRLSLPYVIPGDTYDEAFMIGFNLNQGHVTNSDPVWPHDTGDEVGICIWGSGFDRIQVDDGQDNYYCVETTGCVEWGDFRKECWDASPGSALPNNEQVYNAAAIQPARTDTEHPGTICITSMYFWDGT